MTRELEQLRDYVDAMATTNLPEEEAVLAHLAWDHCSRVLVPAIAASRYQAVIRLRQSGLLLSQIADLLGVTVPRVSQMIRSGGGVPDPVADT